MYIIHGHTQSDGQVVLNLTLPMAPAKLVHPQKIFPVFILIIFYLCLLLTVLMAGSVQPYHPARLRVYPWVRKSQKISLLPMNSNRFLHRHIK